MGMRRLVILGCGFGGLDVARAIGRSRVARTYWDTRVVDKENFFQFNPLLPAVAVGSVETRHIVYPLRTMARHRHLRFLKNKATRIDLERRVVHLHNGLEQPWDHLVVAVGSVTNTFGVPGVAEHARPFKTVVDAMWLRARVVELFEMAEQATTEAQRRRLLSFTVVGGGVTGVEVAAELVEMARVSLLPRFTTLRPEHLSVTVLEAGERIVPMARPEHSDYVARFLRARGVDVRTGARAVRVETHAVVLDDGTRVPSTTIVWVAGVRPPDLVRDLPLAHASDGRVRVDAELRALAPDGTPRDDVHVIGDCAAAAAEGGRLHPQLAQTAVAMGACVGATLVGRATGRPARRFGFRAQGYIISLGQHSSVVDLAGLRLSGRLAWLLWAGAYLVKMVGLRKQIEVGLDHLTHLFFEHDISQILDRRDVLSDEELDLSLGPARDPDARD